ncbi:MAG TPA: DUF4386 domain-containing protein [Actinomycetota bacterium]|nr:DUF4386 domain-containing protein [Actinomycetota bacterium]
MSVEIAAAGFLIVAPLWFNTTFALLGRRFDYPDILRKPAAEILERFHAAGSSLILLWWAFMLSGLLLIPAVVLLGQAIGFTGIVPLAVTVGVLAGLVQMLGLLRWVYLVPSLARVNADPTVRSGQRDATIAVFAAMHRYLGLGMGEHLGYLLTGFWSVLTGIAILGSELMSAWLGWVGIGVGAGLIVGSAEFLGPNEEHGWPLAGAAIPILYVAWSIWLLAMGITLIV